MTPLTWFRTIAIAEACSWAGLLVGMFFKWILEAGELGVEIFGPIHGGLFVVYCLTTAVMSVLGGWSLPRLVLGLVCSVPPFMTLWFDRYAERRDMIPTRWRRVSTS